MVKKKTVVDEAVKNVKTEEGNLSVESTQIEDYFTAYANGASVSHTLFDFQMHFSEVKIFDPAHITAERFATIIMSPPHAKVFLFHLAQNLSGYEARFGEIKVPKEITKGEDIHITAEVK